MSWTSAPSEQNRNALNASVEKTPLAMVEAIALQHFGLAGSAVTLSSERDETFLIRTPGGCGYILKIANPAERRDVLEFQMQALVHLAGKALALPLPKVVPTKEGEMVVALPFGNQRRFVRMLTFLEGQQLYRAPRSPEQMQALGEALALLGKGLADFKWQVPQQDLLWDICNAAALSELVVEVDPSRRTMVSDALDGFDRLASGPINNLPRQVIHNDFNPHNILVSQSDPSIVAGVIDFGDMVEAPLVNDLAVALSYQVGADNGLEDAIGVLAAYHRLRPLDRAEIACLPTLLRTRLAMTVIITEWRAGLHPENRDYILRNHPIAVSGLMRLADFSDADLAALFQQKIGDFS